jgi:hypothetical protein
MKVKTISRLFGMCILTIAAVLAFSAQAMAQAYQQTNLVQTFRVSLKPRPTANPMRSLP